MAIPEAGIIANRVIHICSKTKTDELTFSFREITTTAKAGIISKLEVKWNEKGPYLK